MLHVAPPALLVASTDSLTAVDEAVASAIADLPSPESQRSYECVWRFYTHWLSEQRLDVREVRPKHVQAYIAKLRDEGKVKGTVSRALTVIRSLYAAIVTHELITVGLPDWLANDIREWRLLAGIESGPLFRRGVDDPRPINGAIVYRVVRQMCARAGIDVVSPHSLRRSYVTHAGLRGVDMKKIQGAVSHSSIVTTERYSKANSAATTKVGDEFKDLVTGWRVIGG